MKELPIIFNSEMVNAILQGRKTQTRRIIKQGHIIQSLNNGILPTYIESLDFSPYEKGDVLIIAMEILGYDCKYCADINGDIWSKSSGKWKKLKLSKNGPYFRLSLRLKGKDVMRTVHSLVCTAWHGEKPISEIRYCVRHLDGESTNNSPINLKWGTYCENWQDRILHGNGINENHHSAKLNWETVEYIRKSNKNASQLSKELGFNSRTIDRVKKNETWKERSPIDQEHTPRIWLRVADLRVERLQHITEEDANREGVKPAWCDSNEKCLSSLCSHECQSNGIYWDYMDKTQDGFGCNSAKESFQSLWQSIYGTWDQNPWVWVVEFEVLSTTARP